jgi:hypothetical protein
VAASSIAENLARVREGIAAAAARAGRRADQITLVAVAKTFPADRIRAAYEAGARHFGENRVQEWEAKAPLLRDLDATWHLVGHLQSNKARRAASLFHSIDSVDSLALAQKLDRAVGEQVENPNPEALVRPFRGGEVLPILIEVRLAPEETKSGVGPDELAALADAVLALPHLDLRGLMCIPPYYDDPEKVRPYFRRLRELRNSLRAHLASGHSEGVRLERPTEESQHASAAAPARAPTGPVVLPELSMGMSHDFEVAIEEGATQIRLGTALFGPRTP